MCLTTHVLVYVWVPPKNCFNSFPPILPFFQMRITLEPRHQAPFFLLIGNPSLISVVCFPIQDHLASCFRYAVVRFQAWVLLGVIEARPLPRPSRGLYLCQLRSLDCLHGVFHSICNALWPSPLIPAHLNNRPLLFPTFRPLEVRPRWCHLSSTLMLKTEEPSFLWDVPPWYTRGNKAPSLSVNTFPQISRGNLFPMSHLPFTFPPLTSSFPKTSSIFPSHLFPLELTSRPGFVTSVVRISRQICIPLFSYLPFLWTPPTYFNCPQKTSHF